MKVRENTFIEDDFATIVSRVSDVLTPQLKAVQPSIEGVFFQFGTVIEFNETLIQLGKTEEGKHRKYPVVYLFVDITSPRGLVSTNQTSDLRLRIAILNFTNKNFKAKERLEHNFKPILEPIYNELMKQIVDSGFFIVGNVSQIRHDMTRRYYWGTQTQSGHDGNTFPDFIDGIDIENLELKHYLTRCFEQPNEIIT